MHFHSDQTPAPFGSLLGIAPGGVAAYSSDYDSVDELRHPDRSSFRHFVDGLYMGYKWQCVEFARRWLYVNRGWVFDDVAMAYDIFELRSIRDVKNGTTLPLHAFANGARRHPEPGCLLVWSASGEFDRTGHVAVVTEVFPDRLRLAEQNVGHREWPEGCDFAREIPARVVDGAYWLQCSFDDAAIIGWVIQTDDDRHAEPVPTADPRLLAPRSARVAETAWSDRPWLDVSRPAEAAYVAAVGGHKLADDDANRTRYVVISETAHAELAKATDRLHSLFSIATEHVLADDDLLARFNLPRSVWSLLRSSWEERRRTITGRFDFALSERGLKVYEYNCDSAACHFDAGRVQGRWAVHVGCTVGCDPGERLLGDLVRAWRRSEVQGPVHLMIDRDPEERYHARFMQEALAAAGLESTVVEGLEGVAWSADGGIVDPAGAPIRTVWKSWAWETALDQIRAADGDDGAGARRRAAPRLVDVLLHPAVTVFEPLWTVIPSNKAILPILWEMFPGHRYLLEAAFELTPEIRAKGYVQKPISGRCGANVSLFDANDALIEETAGRFASPFQMYQELWPLPAVDGDSVQVSTFTAAGTYAGACVRIDPSRVITAASDLVALRVVADDQLLDAAGSAAT